MPVLGSSAQVLPSKQDIILTLKKVNHNWISRNPVPGNNQWARAAYFTGNMDFYKVYPLKEYLDYANLWAMNNAWGLSGGVNTTNADNQIAGQVYIDLFQMDAVKDSSKIVAVKSCMYHMVNNSISDSWWWIDALYMAMPVFARMSLVESNDIFLYQMHHLYENTKVTRGLYNPTDHLWYRDESFDPPYTTLNGKNSYWSRGNGWVFAAHARVLQLLPMGDPYRNEYVSTFQDMAHALMLRQRIDGFWNVSLDDPDEFGGPETSGTAFFLYGMAWGINNGFLDSATYYPVVAKAWNALSSVAVQSNGFLGYVQGVGTNPASSQPVTSTTTADFGVGAFLLAGSEVVKLASGTMPVPSLLRLSSVEVTDPTHVKVFFSKAHDNASSLNVSNYQLDMGVQVKTVVSAGTQSVMLEVSELSFGIYHLNVSGIYSEEGEEIELGESKSFVYTNIKAVTASGFEANTSNTPDKTMDFDYSTRWSCNGIGQWIMYDLGEVQMVTSVGMSFYRGDVRFTYFDIELSMNGTDFYPVYSGSSGGTTNDLEYFDFEDQNARFIRVVGRGNSESSWNSITEVRIHSLTLTSDADKEISGTRHSHLDVLPNPFNTSGTLFLSGGFKSGNDVFVQISNLEGAVLYRNRKNLWEGMIRLDHLSLPQGIYLVSCIQNEQNLSGLLMVK